MKIANNSFLCGVAYGYRDYVPNQTNLCRLFWLTIVSLFVTWPILLVLNGIFYLSCFLLGFRPLFDGNKLFRWSNNRLQVHKYQFLPSIAGHRIWPLSIFLPLAIFFYAYFDRMALFMVLGVVFAVAVIVGLLLAIASIFFWLQDSENLVAAYLRAKKEKICPSVYIVKSDSVNSDQSCADA